MDKKIALDPQESGFPTYYDIDGPPLLLQGFPFQGVVAPGTPRSAEQYTLAVNRGAVTGLDYVAFNLATIVGGQDEQNWNAAKVTLSAGGQELIRERLLEKFAYNIDVGNQEEQRIKTRIGGGQTLDSVLTIDPATLSTIPNMSSQLIAHYSTLWLDKWREKFKWPGGLGLKSRTYTLEHTNAINQGLLTLSDTLPKNNGPIVGFSFMYLGTAIFEQFISLSVDGLTLVENVNATRFSRYSQRDPERFLIPLNPGSTFDFTINVINTSSNPGLGAVTFYFGN